MLDRVWTGAQIAIAVVAGYWFGLPGAFKALMLLQALDVATGMLAATRAPDPAHRLSSAVATAGIKRKGQVWAVVGMVYVLQTYLAVALQVSLWGYTPAAAVAAWFAIAEALSIVENAERSGIKIPVLLSNALAQQRKQFDVQEDGSK